MILLKATVPRKDLKFPNSVATQEIQKYDNDQNMAAFFSPMINMLCRLINEP